MTNQRRVLLSTPLIIVVFTLLGCSVGLVTPFMREYELGPQWRSLGTPPVMPVKLLAADFHTIYVQTSDQQLYSCYRESRFDQRCWIAITAVPPIEPGGCGPDQPHNAPPPPIEPIQQIYESFCDRFNRSEYTYVLGRDGTVMQWVDDAYHGNVPPAVAQERDQFLVWGLGSGFMIGLMLVGVYALRRRYQHRQQ